MLKLTLATAAVVITLHSPVSARQFSGNGWNPPEKQWNTSWWDYRAPKHGRTRRHSSRAHHSTRHTVSHVSRRHSDKVSSTISQQVVEHPSGCPHRAFCGCGTALHIFGKPIRELWLASNWFKFPPASPAPGMVAVRRHHVFAILKVIGPGVVLAYDPNSGGHQTRIHVRRLAGYSVRNPHGSRYASN